MVFALWRYCVLVCVRVLVCVLCVVYWGCIDGVLATKCCLFYRQLGAADRLPVLAFDIF